MNQSACYLPEGAAPCQLREGRGFPLGEILIEGRCCNLASSSAHGQRLAAISRNSSD